MKKMVWMMLLLVFLLAGCFGKDDKDESTTDTTTDVTTKYITKIINTDSSSIIDVQHGNRVIISIEGDISEISSFTASNGNVEKYNATQFYYDAPFSGIMDTIIVSYKDSTGEDKKKLYQVNLKNKVTFILYLASENSLGTYNYNTDDMEEIAKTAIENYNRNVNIVVYVDTVSEKVSSTTGNGCYYYTGVTTDTITINGVALTGFKKSDYYGTGNTGIESELTGFINYAKENFPSEKYVLDLWSHGDGWRESSYEPAPAVRQIVEDQGDNSSLDMWEVESAIKNSKIPKMDIIYMDACLMGGIEVAYQLKDVSDYLVFSPELTPGPGGDYEGIINSINSNYSSSETMAEKIVEANDTFYKNYVEKYTESGKSVVYNYSYVFTAVDQSKLSLLTDTLKSAYEELMLSENSSLVSKVKANKSNILCYSYKIINQSEEYNTNTIYVDLGSFWNNVETLAKSTTHTANLQAKIDAFQSAYSDYIIANKYGDGKYYINGKLNYTEYETGSTGISIYTDLINLSGEDEYSEYKTATYYGALSWWQIILEEFYKA